MNARLICADCGYETTDLGAFKHHKFRCNNERLIYRDAELSRERREMALGVHRVLGTALSSHHNETGGRE